MKKINYTIIMGVIYVIFALVMSLLALLSFMFFKGDSFEYSHSVLIFVIICALVVGSINFLFFKFISNLLINRVIKVLNKVKDGDLSVRLHTDSNDIIGRFTKQLNATISHLEQLDHHLYRDQLTNLPNRLEMLRYYETAIRSNSDKKYFIFYFDVDDFKKINDTFGHQIGDKVLIKIGRRLNNMLLPNERAFRLGGDEFVVITVLEQDERICLYYRKLKSLFMDALDLEDDKISRIKIDISIGCSEYGVDGKELHTLLEKADQAMYHEKKKKKEGPIVFTNRLKGSENR